MNGQMKKSKKQIVEDYIKRVNPYKKPEPVAFDLRGYAKYLDEHNISGKAVPMDVMKMFQQ